MFISEIRLTFETLEKAMNLPPTAKVVAVQEEDTKGILKFRIVSTTPPPEEYSFDALSMAGTAYTHPERYKTKDRTMGAIPSDDVADVSVQR
jgi:hypothetical protein